MRYFIKGNFYFDIDLNNQLRITGPENHLLLGWTFPKDLPIRVEEYDEIDGQLSLEISLPTSEITLPLPIVTDIRSLRQQVEGKKPQPTYKELLEAGFHELMPRERMLDQITGAKTLSFINRYTDLDGDEFAYGVKIYLPDKYQIDLFDDTIKIVTPDKFLQMLIYSVADFELDSHLEVPIFSESLGLNSSLFSDFLLQLYEESRENIEHLIKSKKTSSFEYGTIFPRDWIESADLGLGDLSSETIDHMYEQSMKYVSESGEGWHEDVIGEYRVKLQGSGKFVDRKMIDIEPHYILGVPRVSKKFLFDDDNREKLKKVANFVITQAKNKELISFKQTSDTDEFYKVGNWRDSVNAFPEQMSPLAPYDVNCVFYPEALRVIRLYHEYFDLDDTNELDALIEKWQRNKAKFKLYHPNQIIGYSLALHGKKNIPMPTAHLDESYDLFYGSSDFEELSSFARKIIDPDYFYTPGGPILVAADEPYFNTQQYHGKVIWPKQAAFAVGGMAINYRLGLKEHWPEQILNELAEAIIITAEACFRGWEEIKCVPELYYYDQQEKRARLYTDQEEFEGQMSLIQLWSSVGCRRIMREYSYIMQQQNRERGQGREFDHQPLAAMS